MSIWMVVVDWTAVLVKWVVIVEVSHRNSPQNLVVDDTVDVHTDDEDVIIDLKPNHSNLAVAVVPSAPFDRHLNWRHIFPKKGRFDLTNP